MARKPKDLYTVLQAQRRSGKGSFRGRAAGGPANKGYGAQSLTELLGHLWSWFTGRGRPPAKADAKAPAGIVLSGPALAAIVFASLGVGFLLGDMIGLGSGDAGLRAAEKTASRGQETGIRPGPMGSGVRLAPTEETRVLADQALFVTRFGADQKETAGSLAEWLRGQGIETARIYLFWPDDRSGSSHWLVLAYFDGEEPPDELVQKLRALPANADCPEFDRQRKSLADWPTPVRIQ